MAKMMGVESMGEGERIVNEAREENLNKASDDACEKIWAKQDHCLKNIHNS
jgi:hypothetical protein